MADERFEIMRKVTLFEGLSDRELEAVAHRRRSDASTPATRSSSRARVASASSSSPTARRGSRSPASASARSPRGSFGEVALLDDGGRRTASVIAESPLRVYGLTAWQFTPLLEQHPSIAIKIAKILARRLREAEERTAAPA